MATIELTGAEEVAWDLADLYENAGDPALEGDIKESEDAAAAFRERYYGKVAELDAAALAEAIAERERIDEVFTRAAYYATCTSRRTWPTHRGGALVARLTEKGAVLETELLFFTLEVAAIEDEPAEALLASEGSPTAGTGSSRCGSSARISCPSPRSAS